MGIPDPAGTVQGVSVRARPSRHQLSAAIVEGPEKMVGLL